LTPRGDKERGARKRRGTPSLALEATSPTLSSRGAQAPRDPLACTRGERKNGSGQRKSRLGATALFCHFERSEKSPHPVMPLPLSCRAIVMHPSLRSGRRPPYFVRNGVSRETPRLTPRGDKERGARECRGTPRYARGDIPHPVIPRRASAEGPPRFARGDKKGLGVKEKMARGDKKVGSGRQQKSLHKNIFNTASVWA
jgi:hypothetical protein